MVRPEKQLKTLYMFLKLQICLIDQACWIAGTIIVWKPTIFCIITPFLMSNKKNSDKDLFNKTENKTKK